MIADLRDTDRPILCLDFDGTISEYKHPYRSDLENEYPVAGAIEFLTRAVDFWTVRIFSYRGNTPAGIAAISAFLLRHGLPIQAFSQIIILPGKPPWFLAIDDRALRFTGNWAEFDAEALRSFKPWYYAHPEWNR